MTRVQVEPGSFDQGSVVVFLDKMLYEDYLCLVAGNKQQSQ